MLEETEVKTYDSLVDVAKAVGQVEQPGATGASRPTCFRSGRGRSRPLSAEPADRYQGREDQVEAEAEEAEEVETELEEDDAPEVEEDDDEA